MTSRTFGILWRRTLRKGTCQLLTIMDSGNFYWSHGYKDNSTSHVFRVGVDPIIASAIEEDGAYWVGPREMSGWGNDS